MTEEEKLDAGLYYDFWDAGVNKRKLNAIRFCKELRKLQGMLQRLNRQNSFINTLEVWVAI